MALSIFVHEVLLLETLLEAGQLRCLRSVEGDLLFERKELCLYYLVDVQALLDREVDLDNLRSWLGMIIVPLRSTVAQLLWNVHVRPRVL